jgi:hypothetical protein
MLKAPAMVIKRGTNTPFTGFWPDTALVVAKKPQTPPTRPTASGTDSATNKTQLETGVGPQQGEESWWNWFGMYRSSMYLSSRLSQPK